MKIKILKITIFISISLYFCTGCILNTKEDWTDLPDRKFYFSEFQFILLDSNKENAYKFFKDFPVKKIMFMLAKEYNITIDISDFNNFLITKKISAIKAEGSIRTEKLIWNKKNTENNRITFIFERDYFDESKLNLKIGIYSGNSTRKIINTEVSKIDHIFDQLKFQFESGKESLKEYNEKSYDKISPIPLIIETNSLSTEIEESTDLIKIKSMIDDYVKTLDESGKKEFKHDIIDYIYQKCN